jgi:hypothetical protein
MLLPRDLSLIGGGWAPAPDYASQRPCLCPHTLLVSESLHATAPRRRNMRAVGRTKSTMPKPHRVVGLFFAAAGGDGVRTKLSPTEIQILLVS